MIKYIFQLALALILLYWGYQNLYPIEMLEYRFVEQYIGGWYVAPVLARILVGLNWSIAAFLILNIKPKKWMSISLLLLVGLHVYNLIWEASSDSVIILENYTLIFEDKMWVSYVILLGMFGFAVELLRSNISSNFIVKWLKYPVAVTLIVLPFVLNAIFWDDLTDTTDLFHEQFQTNIPNNSELTALTKERVLVCFYSTSCPFCVRASKKIAVAQKRYPYFPEVFVLFQGDQYGAKYFLETAKVNFDYSVLSLDDYTKLTGLTFPRFQLVYQGNIDRKWDGQTFNYSVMNKLSLGEE